MGQKTKIDWCDSTWNPITGCLHGCEYCYARGIASRFAGCDKLSTYMPNCQATWRRVNPDSDPEDAIFEVDAQCPPINIFFDAKKQKVIHRIAPYPWGFQPTLRRDKLGEPSNWKKPRNIFVCSMSDLFGEWVPDEWIAEVFAACEKAPQHRYLFLTKNPDRLCKMANAQIVNCFEMVHQKPHPRKEEFKGVFPLPRHDNWWFGSTLDNAYARRFQGDSIWNTFTSIEPLTEYMNMGIGSFGSDCWTIIGAETGNRKDKVIPKREWVDNILEAASITGVKVFMKESLRGIMGSDFRQEFPWGDNDRWRFQRTEDKILCFAGR